MLLCYIIQAMCNFRGIRSAVQNTLLASVLGTESSVTDGKSKHLKIDATVCQCFRAYTISKDFVSLVPAFLH